MSLYALDFTGALLSNKVVSEVHPLTSTVLDKYKFIIPQRGPFFKNGVVVKYTNSNNIQVTLTYGIHYNFDFKFSGAILSSDNPVYGCITLMPGLELLGFLTIEYQTLGGIFSINPLIARGDYEGLIYITGTATIELINVNKLYYPIATTELKLDSIANILTCNNNFNNVNLSVIAKYNTTSTAAPIPIGTTLGSADTLLLKSIYLRDVSIDYERKAIAYREIHFPDYLEIKQKALSGDNAAITTYSSYRQAYSDSLPYRDASRILAIYEVSNAASAQLLGL
jgi:hypothetical protein